MHFFLYLFIKNRECKCILHTPTSDKTTIPNFDLLIFFFPLKNLENLENIIQVNPNLHCAHFISSEFYLHVARLHVCPRVFYSLYST